MALTSLRKTYESALLSNASTLSTVESTLRNVSWFLPGRFEDAELASEGLYSGLNLISLYHDTILSELFARQRRRLPPSPFPPLPTEDNLHSPTSSSFPTTPSRPPPASPSTLPNPSEHYLYTTHLSRISRTYRRAARSLVVIGYLQLVLEMLVRKRAGQRRGWRLIMWLEAIKSSIRLVLLSITRRPLLAHPLPRREVDPSLLDLDPTPNPKKVSQTNSAPQPTIPTLPETVSVATTYLLPKLTSLSEAYHPSPLSALPELSSRREFIGEAMNATQGLVNVFALLWFARGRRARLRGDGKGGGVGNTIAPLYDLLVLSDHTAKATMIPILYALVARHLRLPSSSAAQSDLLTTEYAERDTSLAYLFLRGTIYTRWTRPKLVGLLDWARERPVVGIVAALAGDHLRLVDEYWYYTSS